MLSSIEGLGSCATTAIVDSRAGILYLANLGDSRAVAGWYNKDTTEWRCDVLSEDASAKNPKEVKR
jgi:pyruvate dehydrogenase phosphatase